MHYSRHRQDQANTPTISLPGANGTDVTIRAQASTKWLGIYLDRTLSFDTHIKQLAAQAERAVNGMGLLANTVRGLSQDHVRRLYTACVRPIMTYTSPAWWKGKKKQEAALTRVQNRALRLICAVFRTTPIAAMEIEAAIPPIRHHLNHVCENAAIRLNKLDAYSPILRWLPDTWHLRMESRTPPPPRTTHRKVTTRRRTPPASTRLSRLAELTDPQNERLEPLALPPWKRTTASYNGRLRITPAAKGTTKEEAAKAHKAMIKAIENEPTNIFLYSDGSLLTDQTG